MIMAPHAINGKAHECFEGMLDGFFHPRVMIELKILAGEEACRSQLFIIGGAKFICSNHLPNHFIVGQIVIE